MGNRSHKPKDSANAHHLFQQAMQTAHLGLVNELSKFHFDQDDQSRLEQQLYDFIGACQLAVEKNIPLSYNLVHAVILSLRRLTHEGAGAFPIKYFNEPQTALIELQKFHLVLINAFLYGVEKHDPNPYDWDTTVELLMDKTTLMESSDQYNRDFAWDIPDNPCSEIKQMQNQRKALIKEIYG